MKIAIALPPNFAKIATAFDLRKYPGAIFCCGDTIHNPSGGKLSEALIAHEATHAERQRAVGGPELWWDSYIEVPSFRLEEETLLTAAMAKEIIRAEVAAGAAASRLPSACAAGEAMPA